MTRLLLDAMLGRLTTYLRMCGYDVVYTLDEGLEADEEILASADSESRTLLTRDRELAGRCDDALLLDSREIADQLAELAVAGFELDLPERPERCSVCNGTLDRVGPAHDTPEYAPDPAEVAVWQCECCGQHFWKGSHWDDVEQTLEDIESS